MLEQVLMNIRRWFPVEGGIHSGTFTIKDGGITLPFLQMVNISAFAGAYLTMDCTSIMFWI